MCFSSYIWNIQFNRHFGMCSFQSFPSISFFSDTSCYRKTPKLCIQRWSSSIIPSPQLSKYKQKIVLILYQEHHPVSESIVFRDSQKPHFLEKESNLPIKALYLRPSLRNTGLSLRQEVILLLHFTDGGSLDVAKERGSVLCALR